MNTNVLEKVVRRAMRGEDVSEKAKDLVKRGVLTPAEHRSLESLSSQIVANVRAETGSGTVAFAQPNIMWL